MLELPDSNASRTPEPRPSLAAGSADPRLVAFTSSARPEIFHAVAYQNDIWRADPFDVETIHAEPRAVFQRLVERATGPSGGSGGRVLLLQGEAGSGKTHLMRAFRNWTHGGGRGYCGYMQMTSATDHYGRYVLNNLIDSLDQPYDERVSEMSGLMRLSIALAESPRGLSVDRLEAIRGGELDQACLAKLIDALADQVVMDERFDKVDLDLIRAVLFLQTNDPRIKGRVLKYLRCEDLSDPDRGVLGGLVPRSYDDAPQRVIRRLGDLMAALACVPLIVCIDQLEDIYNLQDAAARFRRAMATLCDIANRIPTAIVVISCLENFYDMMKGELTKPIRDRIENDPKPIVLKGPREPSEIALVVSRRLRDLYGSLGATWREDEPTYPFPDGFLRKLAGLPTREVLIRCQEYRERCVAEAALVAPGEALIAAPLPGSKPDTTSLERSWNDSRTAFSGEPPETDDSLAALLAGAIRDCSDEVESGYRFEADADGRMITVVCHSPQDLPSRLLIGVCNVTARGGYLGRQVAELEERAGDDTPVIVRLTEFPSSSGAAVTKQIGALIARGGRRAVIEDSEWRAMMAMPRFREEHHDDPAFPAWLKEGKPLSRLRSLRTILALDRPRPVRSATLAAPRAIPESDAPQVAGETRNA